MKEHQRGHQHPGGGAGGVGEEARALGDAAAVDRRQVSENLADDNSHFFKLFCTYISGHSSLRYSFKEIFSVALTDVTEQMVGHQPPPGLVKPRVDSSQI